MAATARGLVRYQCMSLVGSVRDGSTLRCAWPAVPFCRCSAVIPPSRLVQMVLALEHRRPGGGAGMARTSVMLPQGWSPRPHWFPTCPAHQPGAVADTRLIWRHACTCACMATLPCFFLVCSAHTRSKVCNLLQAHLPLMSTGRECGDAAFHSVDCGHRSLPSSQVHEYRLIGLARCPGP